MLRGCVKRGISDVFAQQLAARFRGVNKRTHTHTHTYLSILISHLEFRHPSLNSGMSPKPTALHLPRRLPGPALADGA